MAVRVGAVLGGSQEPGARNFIQMNHMSYKDPVLEHHLLPSRIFMTRELESGARTGIHHRHPNVGCEYLNL